MSALPSHEPVECPHDCGVDVMPIVEDGTARCPVCSGDVLANTTSPESLTEQGGNA